MHKCEGCGQKCLCDGEEYDWFAAPVDCLCDHRPIDPDAPDMIVFPDLAPNKLAREAAYEIIGLMDPDVDRVEQIIIKHLARYARRSCA